MMPLDNINYNNTKNFGFYIILVYTDTQNFWVLTGTRTVSLILECF